MIEDNHEAIIPKEIFQAVLEQVFVEVFNEIKLNKEEILGTVAANIEKVLKSRTDVQQIEKFYSEIEVLKEQLRSLVQKYLMRNMQRYHKN